MYQLGLEQKTEWLFDGETFLSRPLGSALLAFVSGDAPESHPLLADAAGEEELREMLRLCVEAVLTAEGEGTPLQRLYDLCLHRSELRPAGECIRRRILMKGAEDVETHVFFSADTLGPLLFAELEQMAELGVTVRRCEYCGKFFVPFSSRALYCDRMVGESGKSCKELAAREKYENKIAEDEGRALYQRRSKAYAMRVRRDPQRFSEEEYRAWKDYAEMAIRAHGQGKLPLEVLEMVLELPEN